MSTKTRMSSLQRAILGIVAAGGTVTFSRETLLSEEEAEQALNMTEDEVMGLLTNPLPTKPMVTAPVIEETPLPSTPARSSGGLDLSCLSL